MTTLKNRTLTKGLVPALLLSTALSLPAVSVAAPSPNGKAHAEHGNKDKNLKHQQKQVAHEQKHVAKQQAKVVKQQAKVQRQQAQSARPGKVVYVAPAPARRAGRTVYVAPAPAPRTVYVAPAARNNRGRWEGWNRRYSKYGSGNFQLDGTFIDQQYGCVLVRDHQGQVIPLVGNPGDLRRGEHLLLSGRVENGTVCGTAFRVYNVDRVWADANHRRVVYDRNRDGDYYGSDHRYGQDDRYGRDDRYDRYDRDDRRDDRYDDRYDRDRRDNEQLISVDGRIDRTDRCTTLRADNGDRYGLSGDLGRYREGERVRVIGFLEGRSDCASRTIEVQEVRGR